MDSADPLSAARWLRAAGEEVTLLGGERTLLAIGPDDTIVTAPGAGGGLPAVPPRLVHTARGRGLWAGAISYDAGLTLLGLTSRHEPQVPAFAATWHEAYASYSEAAGWRLHGPAGNIRRRLDDAIAAGPCPPAARPPAPRRVWSTATRGGHADLCREAQRLISLGELFEVNLAHVLETPWTEGGFALYERLVAGGTDAQSAYLRAGDVEIASNSPELFLRIVGDRCETRPIKGTRRRGQTPVEDAALEAELRASEKDRAENVMIVDLLRNDLVPTAVRGSVAVEALCEVERTASVMHLVSSVVSTIRPDVRLPDVLVSCFPGGSVTGAPKRRALEIIDRLEGSARGSYCGSVFSYEPAERRLEASIAIRTATVAGGLARYGAGGAVTLLSDADEEAQETIVKAQPFLTAVNGTVEGW